MVQCVEACESVTCTGCACAEVARVFADDVCLLRVSMQYEWTVLIHRD